MGSLRFALVGCGDIGDLRARAVAGSGIGRLVVVGDLDVSRARSFAATFGATAAEGWRGAVERDEVDAVIVSTPPSAHAEVAIAALERGKHVLCEKPLARTPAECRAIVEAARKSGRVLATGFNFRFFPPIREAREVLRSGLIGELDHVRSYAGYSATDHGHSWLHDADEMGGGVLRDNGIHLIDVTRYFLGEVADVKGFASNRVWGFPGAEDNGIGVLRSPDGRLASLHASWSEWAGYRFAVELYGDRGCVRATCFPMWMRVTWSGERGGPTRRRRRFFPWTHLGEHLRSYRWVVTRSFEEELRAFARAVRGEPSEIASGEDGLRAVEIAAAIGRE